jgi:L,D-transpeptidase YcbB
MKRDRRRAAFVALVVALGGGACGGDRVPETLPAETIAAALAVLGDDSLVTLASRDTLRVSSSTVEFYRARAWQPAWSDAQSLHGTGVALYEALGRSDEDGLPRTRYRHDVVERLHAALETKDRERRLTDSVAAHYRAGIDMLLTEGFLRLARDLVTGTLDPAEAGIDWRIETERPRAGIVLERLLAGGDPREIVEHLRPSIPYYERMRVALAHYRAAAARGGWPELPAGPPLKPGERSPTVTLLRQRLLLGADTEEARLARGGEADAAFFDDELKQAVQRFQRRHGIEPDGAVGGITRKELNHTVDERIAEMKLNLDRWRWLPNELGERFVLVNIAGFELELVDDGRVLESMNVVVGRLDRPTPVFADSIRFVVVNPYWNVPNGIFRRDVLPALQRDPYYLARNNMEFANGRVRQRPGPRNALGRFKFMFPNDYDVYLHDTPEGDLFSRTRRDFSSGCIRIERPYDFAKLLLDLQTDAGSERVERMLTHWNERWIRLDRALPIYLLYFTAWVEEDGTVRFHHDVYGRDARLEEQFEQRLRAEASAA